MSFTPTTTGTTAISSSAALRNTITPHSAISPTISSRPTTICLKYNAKLNGIARPKSQADLAAFVDKAVPLVSDASDRLGELKPPQDEQRIADAWNRRQLGGRARAPAASGCGQGEGPPKGADGAGGRQQRRTRAPTRSRRRLV